MATPPSQPSASQPQKQPTVAVKKADGTTVRMTLDEVKRMRSHPTAESHIDVVKKTVIPQESVEHAPISLDASVEDEPDAPVTQWDADDQTSLLDPTLHNETLPTVVKKEPHALSTTTPVEKYFVDKAAAEASRSAAAMPPKVMARASMAGKPLMHDVIAPQANSGMAQPEIRLKNPRQPLEPLATQPLGQSIHIVTRPMSREMRSVGPAEEIGAFTLTDFRRLSADIPSSTRLVLEKFNTLKDESYVLYMDAIVAWYESPLMRVYLNCLKQALQKRVPLPSVMARERNGDSLNMEEFKAIVGINRALSID